MQRRMQVHAGVDAGACKWIYAYACGGLKRTSGVFLNQSSPLYLKQIFLIEPEIHLCS